MNNKNSKVHFVVIRITPDEKSAWDKAWREHGHRSMSDFVRNCVDTVAMPGSQNLSVRTAEEIIHMKRIGTGLTNIQAQLAANDNATSNPHLIETLHEAIEHVLAISKAG